MATDIEKLQVELTAKVSDYERAMRRAERETARTTREMERRFESTQRRMDRAISAMTASASKGASTFQTALGGLAGGLVAKTITDFADAWQSAGNKIAATGLGRAEADAAREGVAAIAGRARSDFTATADLYARLSRAAAGFGASQGEIAVATEVVAKALKITGASAAETESTLVQLGQALTSGRLQGDELRSLSENAPLVAEAIAKAFGVSVGKLKDLGAEGALTSDRVFRAIIAAQPDVEKAFASTTATIADNWKQLETAAIRYVGTTRAVSGSSAIVAAALGGLANNFEALATGAIALGAVLAARLAAAGLGSVVASFGAAQLAAGVTKGALADVATFATRAGTAAGFMAGAMRAASFALMLAGGPAGLALLGLSAVIVALASQSGEGSTANRVYAESMAAVESQARRAKPAIEGVSSAVDRQTQAMRTAADAAQRNNLASFEESARVLETMIGRLVDNMQRFGAVRVSNGEKEQALAAIKAGLEGNAVAAAEARNRLEELGTVNPSFASAFAKLSDLMRRLAATRESIIRTKAELGGLAAAQSADNERQRSASDQQAVLRAGAPVIGTPAGLDPAFQRLALQRDMALSKIDDTKRRVDAKAKELYERDRALGQALSLSEYAKAAGAIIANEDAAKGGGGGGGGGRGGGKSDAFQQEIASLNERTAALDREREALALSTLEAARAEAAHKLLAAAKQAGIPLTDELRARVEQLSQAYAETKLRLDAARDAQQGFHDLQKFAGQSLSAFFSDIVSGGKNASEALMNLTKKLADAALQALLLGEGPLGKALGLSAPGGKGAGGLIGMLFSGLSGGSATGAPTSLLPKLAVGTSNVPADMPAMIHKGEMVIPKYDASLLRKGGGGGGANVAVTVDVRGATGNAEIQRMVAAGMSQAVAQSQRVIGRNIGPMVQNWQMRHG